jgi:hypothetical protein
VVLSKEEVDIKNFEDASDIFKNGGAVEVVEKTFEEK